MNELIQKFANQAKESVPKGILTPDLWIQEYNKTYAELIVRECANIASNPAPGCHSSFGKIILAHFGVE